MQIALSPLSKVIGSISAVATPIHAFGVCFLPESSSLISQLTGSVHYFYVTDGSRYANLQKWFFFFCLFFFFIKRENYWY